MVFDVAVLDGHCVAASRIACLDIANMIAHVHHLLR